MRIRKTIAAISAIFISVFNVSVSAQEIPVYSQYMFNMLSLNPAYAGSHPVASAIGTFRKQWIGVPGAPQTTAIAMDMPARNNFLGLGLQITDDRIGIQKSTTISTSYAVRIRLGVSEDETEDQVLAIGIQAGLNNLKANYNEVDLFNPYDPSFTGNIVNEFLPSFGAGIYYHSPNFYLGLSSPNLIQAYRDKTSQVVRSSISRFQNSHIFLAAGYVFDASPTIKLKPSLLIRALPGTALQYDLNTNVWFNNKFSTGLSYRTNDALVGLFELPIGNSLQFGYAYAYTIGTTLKTFSRGTHEMMLRFELNGGQKTNQSPRYF
jgi:type IX secretion system PorP/SprF family membrane protein